MNAKDAAMSRSKRGYKRRLLCRYVENKVAVRQCILSVEKALKGKLG